MSDTFRIYHNPRCSKSRQTLELLRTNNVEPELVEYLKTPPSHEELREILTKLDMGARQLIRDGEAEYKELGLDDPALTEDELINAMVNHPRLMQRPVVVHGNRAVIGRPPETVLEILGGGQ